jgi:hypothetical protein
LTSEVSRFIGKCANLFTIGYSMSLFFFKKGLKIVIIFVKIIKGSEGFTFSEIRRTYAQKGKSGSGSDGDNLREL